MSVSEKYLFVGPGIIRFRPASIYNSFVVEQDGIGGKYFVEGKTIVTGQSIADRVTPERDTIQEAEQDLLRLYARLNNDGLAFDPTPTEGVDLNFK